MPGTKGFSPTNLKYMSYFYKIYAPLVTNRQQVAGDFVKYTYNADIQRVSDNKQKRQQPVDDFSLLFLIPWGHHCRILKYVAIELKVQSFHPSFLGQLSFYVSAINHQFKTDIDNPTIGHSSVRTKITWWQNTP